jgi:hypothetical protein
MEEAVNSTVDILCRARALYASAPSHVADPALPDVGTYCALLALTGSGASVDCPAANALRKAMDLGGGCIVDWNAEHTTEEVLAAFDRAIEAQRLVVPPLQRPERPVPVEA